MNVISRVTQRVADHIYGMAPEKAMSGTISEAVGRPATLHLPAGEDTLPIALRDAQNGADLTNVAIFSYLPGVEAHRLHEELSARGVRAHIMNIEGLQQAENGAFTYRGEPMPHLDGAVMYDGAMGPASGPEKLDALEASGTFVTQKGDALRLSRDKIKSAERFAQEGVPQPDYVALRSDADIEHASTKLFSRGIIGPRGVVVKEAVGTHGEGVRKVTEPGDVASVVTEMRQSDPNLLAQKLVNAHGRDLRIVVGADEPGGDLRVLTSVARTSRKKGEFRANVSLGGAPTPAQPTAKQSKAAIDAVRALGLDFGGADVFQNQSVAGWLRNKVTGWEPEAKVIEVNSGPDTSEWITGDSVFGPIANYVAEGATRAKAERAGSPA